MFIQVINVYDLLDFFPALSGFRFFDYDTVIEIEQLREHITIVFVNQLRQLESSLQNLDLLLNCIRNR